MRPQRPTHLHATVVVVPEDEAQPHDPAAQSGGPGPPHLRSTIYDYDEDERKATEPACQNQVLLIGAAPPRGGPSSASSLGMRFSRPASNLRVVAQRRPVRGRHRHQHLRQRQPGAPPGDRARPPTTPPCSARTRRKSLPIVIARGRSHRPSTAPGRLRQRRRKLCIVHQAS